MEAKALAQTFFLTFTSILSVDRGVNYIHSTRSIQSCTSSIVLRIVVVFCSDLSLPTADILGDPYGHTETATQGMQDLKHTHAYTHLYLWLSILAWDLALVAVKIAYRQLPWSCSLLQSLGLPSGLVVYNIWWISQQAVAVLLFTCDMCLVPESWINLAFSIINLVEVGWVGGPVIVEYIKDSVTVTSLCSCYLPATGKH